MSKKVPGQDAILAIMSKSYKEHAAEETAYHIALLEKSFTIAKTEKEKKLAALAEPKDKITHADVMKGRGVSESAEVQEGWDDMLKAAKEPKGTGKFDSKKISTGTVYTRKASTFDDGGKDDDMRKADKKGKKEKEVEEAISHQASTTVKHIKDPGYQLRAAANDIKPGVKGYRDRIALLKAAQAAGKLKEDVTEARDTPGQEHICAVHVKHATFGEGKTLFSQHAEPDAEGKIAWYDVMFAESIQKKVPTSDLEIVAEMSHGSHKKKAKAMREEIDLTEAAKEPHPDAIHVSDVGGGKYKVHAVGKNYADGIKVGEHLTDTHLDDASEMGAKVKMVKEKK